MIARLGSPGETTSMGYRCRVNMRSPRMITGVRRSVLALCIGWLLVILQGCSVTSEFMSELAGTSAGPTPLGSPTPELQLVPTFTPVLGPAITATSGPTVTANTNLHQGPGAHYPTMGWLVQGTPVQITARSADGMWLLLASGHWIEARTVSHTPQDSPVVIVPTPTPIP